jgi:hypothetical protein
MSIILREDVTYFLLERLSRPTATAHQQLELQSLSDRQINPNEILLHLHYLTQWGYVAAQPGATATSDAVEAFPLGHVALTQQGQQFYKRLVANSPHLAGVNAGLATSETSGFLAL